MLGFDRRAARAAWSVFLVALLLFVIYHLRKVLLVFTLAVLFAYLLSPLVDLVDRFLPARRSRAWSLAVVYVLLIGVLVTLGIIIGSRVTEQAATLVTGFPKLVENVKATLASPDPAWLH